MLLNTAGQALTFLYLLISTVRCTPVKNVVNMKAEVDEVESEVGVVEFDWRSKGVISPVSNQGKLGSSTDYAIKEGVESLYAIDTQSAVTLLSVEEVRDCCDDASGHSKFKGFDCIVAIGGLCSQASYPSSKGKCGNNTCSAVGKVGSTIYIPANREDIMMKMILQTPLIVAIDASLPSFQDYSSGIYSDPACQTTLLDHTMQVVGYGYEDSQDYWILKNSWGISWGEQGYMRIRRGTNTCGLANAPFFPLNLEHKRP